MFQVGSIEGKVISVAEASDIINVYGNDLEVKTCTVADQTGTMKMLLWDQTIALVEKDGSYQFSHLSLRDRGGLVLTTCPNTIIKPIEDIKVPENLQESEDPIEHLPVMEGQVMGIVINNNRKCPLCRRGQGNMNTNDRFHRCIGCNMLQPLNNYLPHMSGTLSIMNNHRETKLTIPMSALKDYSNSNNLPNLLANKDLYEEHILETGTFQVTYTPNHIITTLQNIQDPAVSKKVDEEHIDYTEDLAKLLDD